MAPMASSQALYLLEVKAAVHEVVADIIGHLKLFRAHKDEADVLITHHSADKRVHGAAEFQIAAQAHRQAVQAAPSRGGW